MLMALPVLTAAVAVLAFTNTVALAVAGSLVWGVAMGIQESTLRATVADVVPSGRRATAYGLFAGVVGAASLAGGALTGGLYGYSIPVLITVVVVIQVLALVLLAATRAMRR
ncbi:hypothetical protein [Streptomyces albogriseolus]|uniref:hypothetical protein n=1 Tax=Streptomyces albogriseolus TaxID=1887 RepID=UPI0034614D7D